MTDQFFRTSDGTRLHYSEVGSGPRLVCQPGGPGSAVAYLEDLGGLSATRTLVLLDPRATGRSELPADPSSLSFPQLAQDLEDLRLHLGEQQLDLLGHSAGCTVAQVYAAAHPDRLRALVLAAPYSWRDQARADVPAIRSARSGEPWYDDAHAAEVALPDASPAEQAALQRALRPFSYGRWDERTQAHAELTGRLSNKRAQLGFVPGQGFDPEALFAALRAVPAAVLVLGGERDGQTGAAAVATVASWFPAAQQVVLAGAGHHPWVDEPTAFRTVVERFLSAA